MQIDYQQLLDECLIGFIKKVLDKVQKEGMGEFHHLYISFSTDHPEVILSSRIKQLYPKEITIILRYQFEDLKLYDDKFSVRLSFNKIPEIIQVPFQAISSIVDPSVKFSLQFNNSVHNNQMNNLDMDKTHLAEISTLTPTSNTKKIVKKSKNKSSKNELSNSNDKNQVLTNSADIIKIDKFRKKSKE